MNAARSSGLAWKVQLLVGYPLLGEVIGNGALGAGAVNNADGGTTELAGAGYARVRPDHYGGTVVEGRGDEGHVQVGIAAGRPAGRAYEHVDLACSEQLEAVGRRCGLELDLARVSKDCRRKRVTVLYVVALSGSVRLQHPEPGRVGLDAAYQVTLIENLVESARPTSVCVIPAGNYRQKRDAKQRCGNLVLNPPAAEQIHADLIRIPALIAPRCRCFTKPPAGRGLPQIAAGVLRSSPCGTPRAARSRCRKGCSHRRQAYGEAS